MRILMVSGSRADRGLLEPVKVALTLDHNIEVIALRGNGSTAHEIVDSLRGVFMVELMNALEMPRPDLMMILGDRYEIMQAAVVATIYGVPIAHLCGGDITEGSYDNQFRHAITKLSHIHFVTNEGSAEVVRSMGEADVHVVGSPGLDGITDNLLRRNEIPIDFLDTNILVCHYPATLGNVGEFDEVLAAVDEIPGRKIFILPNSDVGSDRALWKLKGREYVYKGLDRQMFLSLMKECDVVVGNTSAGLHEAPSMNTPTVNVGDRQKGRLAGASVIHARAERGEIVEAINCALTGTFVYNNPYGDGNASAKIAKILKDYKPGRAKHDNFRLWVSDNL